MLLVYCMQFLSAFGNPRLFGECPQTAPLGSTALGLEFVFDRSEMPFLRLPVDLTQELLPRLRIPTATLFLIKLFDFVVNHAIDNFTYERANAINSSPRKVDSPPVVSIGCVCPFDVCPFATRAQCSAIAKSSAQVGTNSGI